MGVERKDILGVGRGTEEDFRIKFSSSIIKKSIDNVQHFKIKQSPPTLIHDIFIHFMQPEVFSDFYCDFFLETGII